MAEWRKLPINEKVFKIVAVGMTAHIIYKVSDTLMLFWFTLTCSVVYYVVNFAGMIVY